MNKFDTRQERLEKKSDLQTKTELIKQAREREIAQAQARKNNFLIYSPEDAFYHMTQERSEKEQQLYMITDDVLFNVWDAYSLSIGADYREEYLPYLPHAYDLLSATDNGSDLYDYLVFIEETQYGAQNGDALTRNRAARVVELLLDYRDSIQNDTTPRFKSAENLQFDTSATYPA